MLQTKLDSYDIESEVILVRSLDDNKLYIRKIVELSEKSFSGIPNEIEFNLSFRLIPRVKDITKYIHSSGEYYWAICTDHCNGGRRAWSIPDVCHRERCPDIRRPDLEVHC